MKLSSYIAHTTLVTGTLKGFDQLLNLVLDNVEEHSSGPLLSSTFELSPKSVDLRSARRGPREKQEARLSSIKGSHYHSHQPHRWLGRNSKSILGGRVAVHNPCPLPALVRRVVTFESMRTVKGRQTPQFAAHIRKTGHRKSLR